MDRGGLFRIAGGAVFAATGLAAVGLGVSHSINYRVGVLLVAVAGVLIGAAGVLAVVAWRMTVTGDRARRSGAWPPSIAVESVLWAQTAEESGTVTVTVGPVDGGTRDFRASGMAGRQLARSFGQMLASAVRPTRPAVRRPPVCHSERADSATRNA